MKHFFFCCSMLLIGACAGMPPAWWNPSGTYGTEDKQPAVQVVAPARTTPPVATQTIPTEETIEPVLDTYEELNLSVSEQIPSSSEATISKTSALQEAPNVTEKAEELSWVEEEKPLPTDGSLPLPSVLQ